jgi:NTP pyrophosphatase (non-canonical NTP hydrolase)
MILISIMSQSRQEIINNLAKYIYKIAKEHGFHELDYFQDRRLQMLPSFLMNLHAEISEIWEAYRNNSLFEDCNKAIKMEQLGLKKLNALEEELADIIIRCLDTAHTFNLDIGRAILDKCEYNKTREWKHGKRV